MNKVYKLIGFVMVGLAATTTTAVICELSHRHRLMKRLLQVSNEGYETAHDIIYPERSAKDNSNDLKYGPVFPQL